jgi:hypothetical protein
VAVVQAVILIRLIKMVCQVLLAVQVVVPATSGRQIELEVLV